MTTTENIAALRTVVVRHTAPNLNVIILHGYSMSPDDLAPFAHAVKVPANFFLPCAPHDASPTGFSWWPVDPVARAKRGGRDLADVYPVDRDASRRQLVSFCTAVRQQFSDLPLIVCGFSQGGMLACDAVLCEKLQLDGLALLSASRIAFDEWQTLGSRLHRMPMLISHGNGDPVVPLTAGEALRDFAVRSGAHVTWIPFEGEHQVPLQVWRALRVFCNTLTDKSR